ncbi:PHP domain-containing protein [Patescibacteria group bacterium]|nr:PHP domain-containing protein [Patescibacteria group bacterium]
MTKSSNKKFIDLHFHSVYSDGSLTIPELINQLKKYDLKAVSLTDHNTVAGIKEFLKKGEKAGIKIIPGIELYTHYKKFELHILGYNFDYNYPPLQKKLAILATQRIIDIKKSLKILKKQGFKINEKHLFNGPSKYIGFGGIVKELYQFPENVKKLQKEMKTTIPHFFSIINKYFSKKRPAYLPETSIPIKQAVALIHQAGGLAILAHPAQQLGRKSKIVEELKKIGLDGLELLSPYHRWHDIEYWQRIANSLQLIVTGGSDFHSTIFDPKQALIKEQWQYHKVPYLIYEKLKPSLNKYKKK